MYDSFENQLDKETLENLNRELSKNPQIALRYLNAPSLC